MVNRLYYSNHKSIGFYLKQFFIFFIITFVVFSGCSNHFDRYTPSSEQEKAMTSYKSFRILKDNKSETIFSAIYLNDVYPTYTDDFAHFLVSFYNFETNSTLFFDINNTKNFETNSTLLVDINNTEDPEKYVVLLNGEMALKSESLDSDDLLIDLLPVRTKWSKYYYIRFDLPKGVPTLVLKSSNRTKSLSFIQKTNNKTLIKVGTVGSQ